MNLLANYRNWRERRRNDRIEKWAKTRENGRSWYVAGFALRWSVLMSAFILLTDFLFNQATDVSIVVVRLILFFLGGLWIGHSNWKAAEKEFLKSDTSELRA